MDDKTVQSRFLERSSREKAQDRAYAKVGLKPFQRKQKKQGGWPE